MTHARTRARAQTFHKALSCWLTLAALGGCTLRPGDAAPDVGVTQSELLITRPAAKQMPPGGSMLGYGNAVANDGDLVIVGAPESGKGAGAVVVYRSPTDPGTTLTAPPLPFGADPSNIGLGCAVTAGHIGQDEIVGAADGCGTYVNGGKHIYLWMYNRSTKVWDAQHPINVTAPGEAPVIDLDLVGTQGDVVALTRGGDMVQQYRWERAYTWMPGWSQPSLYGKTIDGPARNSGPILVGKPGANQVQVIAGSTPMTIQPTSGERDFGRALSFDGKHALIGSRGGATMYTLDTSATFVDPRVLPKPANATAEEFGATVAVDGLRAVVGAHLGNAGAGHAFAYGKRGRSWLSMHELQPSSSTGALWFGRSVSLSGNKAIVGAPDVGAGGRHYEFTIDWDENGMRSFDVSQDGVADLLIGNPGYAWNGLVQAGAASLKQRSALDRSYTGGNTAGETTPGASFKLGAASAWGDFDGDGLHDFVIAAPQEKVAGKANAGSFTLYTAKARLAGQAPTLFVRGGRLTGTPGANDKLGTAFAVGDFNADGIDDLAVGAPGDTYKLGGSVQVLIGGATFPARQDLLYASGAASAMQYGFALASGDFNCDGYADLAIGVPGDTNQTGRVYVHRGDDLGVALGADQSLTQFGSDGTEYGDQFGYSLAALNYDHYRLGGSSKNHYCDDLAVGAPYEDSLFADSGRVSVFTGGVIMKGGAIPVGLAPGFSIDEEPCDIGDLPDMAAAGNNFGKALALVHLDDDAFDDLAIGVPGKSVSGKARAGQVYVLRGSANGFAADAANAFAYPQSLVTGVATANNEFGAALGSAGPRTLLIGAPNHTFSGFANAGEVLALELSASAIGSVATKTQIDQTKQAAPYNVHGKWFGTSLSGALPAR